MNPKSLAALKIAAGEPAPKLPPKAEPAPQPATLEPDPELLAVLRELVASNREKLAAVEAKPVRHWRFSIHRDEDGFQDYIDVKVIE